MAPVPAPAALLLDPVISSAAKLVWLICRLRTGSPQPDQDLFSPSVLARASGLARPTIRKALAQLAQAAWYDPGARALMDRPPIAPAPAVPAELLVDHRLGAHARVLYGTLQLLPGFRTRSGSFTYLNLSRQTGAGLKTTRQAVTELAGAGWLKLAQKNQVAPIQFTLGNPRKALARAELEEARERLLEKGNKGERLMREYLTLLIESTDFVDNARPAFLVNPYTQERMELDRYYPRIAAFEFQGPQHYHETDLYKGVQVSQQQARDLMKGAICNRRGIPLIEIEPQDLSLKRMQQKVAQTRLPLRDLAGHEPLIAYLDAAGRAYRRKSKR